MYGVYVNMCGVVYVQDCIRLYRLCCGVIHIFFMGVVLVRAAGIVFSHRYWWLGLGLCGEVLPGWCGYVGTGYECCDFWCPWNVLFHALFFVWSLWLLFLYLYGVSSVFCGHGCCVVVLWALGVWCAAMLCVSLGFVVM